MYSLNLDLLDYDKVTKLQIGEYETLTQLIGKNLTMQLDIKRASEIPEKYTYKTMAKYNWPPEPPEDAVEYTTKVVDQSKNPDFGYRGSHTVEITQSLIEHMMYNTLKIGIYGMIEGKRPPTKTKDGDDDYYEEIEAQGESQTPR